MSPKSIVVIMSLIMLCVSVVHGQSALVLAADQSITSGGGVMQREKAGRSTRFTDNGNGTVTDNDTGLIWLKNANCFGEKDWSTATSDAANLSTGSCGLLDGSAEGDWRLPIMEEWSALVDTSHSNPALPSDYPFTNVQSSYYWSSSIFVTIVNDGPSNSWIVSMSDGNLNLGDEMSFSGYVWPVRDGQHFSW